jgi:dihydrofolate reductase
MARINATMMISLDGVIQAPGRSDEDTRDGFDRGGWAVPYGDDVMMQKMSEGMSGGSAMLFGRRTYSDFAGYWPHQTDNPFTDHLNQVQKYVVSNTLTEPLPWQNSTVLPGDPAETVTELKAGPGPDLGIVGSAQLLRSLLAAELIDGLTLLIHPIVLGQGRRLFDDRTALKLEFVDSLTTTKGVIIASYHRS